MIQPIRFSILMALFLLATPYQGLSITTNDPNKTCQATLEEGMLLFEQHQYAAAQNYFEAYLRQNDKKNKEEAAYYIILCALKNKDSGIETLVQHFIVSYPKSNRVETVRYRLAKFFLNKGFFHKSLLLFQKIKAKRLVLKDRAALPYALANAYLQLKDWQNAKEIFAQIKDKNNPYYYPAQLHIAYIALEEGNYDGALTALQEVSKSEKYLLEARSLTLQVYHKAEMFESLIAYAKRYPETSFTKQDQLLIADACFFLKQYNEATVHYQIYLDNDSTTDRESLSKLAYALYEMQQHAKALACFKQLFNKEDITCQIALYYSGVIYEKDGATQEAIDAFSKAAGKNFDLEIRDLAYIKRANLYYQQGEIQKVMQSMTTFIQENQNSKSLSAAHVLLVQCYYKTKAYQSAVDYIAALPYKNEALLTLYQKVLFYQGLEEYNKGMPSTAVKYFKKSLLFPFKPVLVSQAQFWLAEALSSLKAYEKALTLYSGLMKQGSLNAVYYEKVLYGLAYAYFNTGHYTSAAQTFEKYLAITQKQASSTHYDATLRLGDCYYVKKNYEQALMTYEKVYPYHPAHVRYQQALIYQILERNLLAEKCLQEVITMHASTKYYEKALHHEACTLFNSGNYERAIQKFSYLIERQPTSDLQPELLMKRAIAYENLQKKEEASRDYATILDKYPTHTIAESALMALSNLFSAQGNPEKIDAYLQKHASIAQHLTSHSDQRMLDTARKLFYSQEYHKVLQQLASFHKSYPQSPLIPEAYFLMAESYYRLKKISQAINYYKKVVASNQTTFYKKAMLRIADLSYQSKQYQEAIARYQALQSSQLNNKEYYQTLIGLIKASFAIKQYHITTPTCLKLLNDPKESPIEIIQQAHLYLGKIAMQRSEFKSARNHFFQASTPRHTVTAAEAQYLLAYAASKLKFYQSSLNILFELIEKFPHNKNYIDNAFLLMADNYISLRNLTQAKATLDSIIKQSKNKKTIHLANKKRDMVISKLKQKNGGKANLSN